MRGFQPDKAPATMAEDFIQALDSGEPSAMVSEPAQAQLNQKEDALTSAFRSMIMNELEQRKNYKEPDENKLFGMNVNMPLIKMGLGILANSGYPNSAGEAIGKGVLGALEDDQRSQKDKFEKNQAKLKELLNMRYMQAMVESMDPNVKAELQRQRMVQEGVQKQIESEVDFQNKMRLFNAQQPTLLESRKDLEKFKADLAMQSMFGNQGSQEDEGINID